MQQAALLFPKAAKASRNVFYDTKAGRPKTMDEVYAFFDKKFSIEDMKDTDIPGYSPTKTQMAQAPANDTERSLYSAAQSEIASNVFVGGVNRSHDYAAVIERPAYNSIYNDAGYQRLAAQHLAANPVEIMLLSQMETPLPGKAKGDLF